jgi:hypothetical protein
MQECHSTQHGLWIYKGMKMGEHSQLEGAIEEWTELVDNLTEAMNAFFEMLADFARRIVNIVVWFALVTMKPEIKRLLESNVYRPDLRRKTALKALGLRFVSNS